MPRVTAAKRCVRNPRRLARSHWASARGTQIEAADDAQTQTRQRLRGKRSDAHRQDPNLRRAIQSHDSGCRMRIVHRRPQARQRYSTSPFAVIRNGTTRLELQCGQSGRAGAVWTLPRSVARSYLPVTRASQGSLHVSEPVLGHLVSTNSDTDDDHECQEHQHGDIDTFWRPALSARAAIGR